MIGWDELFDYFLLGALTVTFLFAAVCIGTLIYQNTATFIMITVSLIVVIITGYVMSKIIGFIR